MLPMQGCGWIPGQGTEIPHARAPPRPKPRLGQSQINKKQKEKQNKNNPLPPKNPSSGLLCA